MAFASPVDNSHCCTHFPLWRISYGIGSARLLRTGVGRSVILNRAVAAQRLKLKVDGMHVVRLSAICVGIALRSDVVRLFALVLLPVAVVLDGIKPDKPQ